MKKTLFLILALIFVVSGCSKKVDDAEGTASPTPAQNSTSGKLQTDDTSKTDLADKMDDTIYAGRVTKITDAEITIIMDEKVEETFILSDKVKSDISDLGVAVDKRVIIKFASAQDKTATSIEVIKSE